MKIVEVMIANNDWAYAARLFPNWDFHISPPNTKRYARKHLLSFL